MIIARISALLVAILLGFVLLSLFIDDLSLGQAILVSGGLATIYFGVNYYFDVRNRARNTSLHKRHFFKGETRLAASLQEAVIIADENHRVVHINPAARELFPDIKIRDSILSLAENVELEALVTSILNSEKPDPFVFQIEDGPVERHIRVTGSLLRPEPILDEKSRAVIIFYDVTALERANALRADFLANASHELKTPVASLLGYIETLRGHAKDDPDAQSMFLGIMQQQAERMQRLISDILSLRRIELSQHRAPTETADLYLAYLAAKESVAPMAKQSQIKIKYSGPKELLVLGAQDELVQLVLNIIDNGVKMTGPENTIQVNGEIIENWDPEEAFPTNPLSNDSSKRIIVSPPSIDIPYAQIRIRDKGPGFKAEHLPRLSERFYRIAGDRSSKEKGTGLGLAIVKHIVVHHRGGLLIETAENVGTEFTILIPVSSSSDIRGSRQDA